MMPCSPRVAITVPTADVWQATYNDPNELWKTRADGDGTHKTWYNKAVGYWDQQEASYNGVLGGFGFVSDIDIHDSKAVLEKVRYSVAGDYYYYYYYSVAGSDFELLVSRAPETAHAQGAVE